MGSVTVACHDILESEAKRKLVTVIQPMNKGLIMVHAHRYTMETFIMVICSTADF